VVNGSSPIWGAGSRWAGWGGYTLRVVREVRWVFSRRLKVFNVFDSLIMVGNSFQIVGAVKLKLKLNIITPWLSIFIFRPQNVTCSPRPKMHQCCKFSENPSNTFQNIRLTVLSAMDACTDAQTHNKTETLQLWPHVELAYKQVRLQCK